VPHLFRKFLLGRTDKEDPRGATFKATLNNSDYAFVTIRKGALRGGHYHDIETTQIIVYGKIKFQFVDPRTRKQSETIGLPMEIIQIPAGIAHIAEGLEDSMFIEPAKVGKTIEYEPQRKRIRDMLERSKTLR